jgi:hypothetical protein
LVTDITAVSVAVAPVFALLAHAALLGLLLTRPLSRLALAMLALLTGLLILLFALPVLAALLLLLLAAAAFVVSLVHVSLLGLTICARALGACSINAGEQGRVSGCAVKGPTAASECASTLRAIEGPVTNSFARRMALDASESSDRP